VKLGTSFTLPFGYVSIIWPASGVILGMYLLFGRSVLVGVILSSIFTMTQDTDFDSLPSYSIFIFSTISILQPVFSKFLITHFCALPININKPKKTLNFLLLTGPVASLASNLVFVVCLWFIVDIDVTTLAYIGVVKWIGDTISVVFFTPIFLFLYKNKFVKKARHTLPSILTSVCCFLLVSFIFLFVTNDDYEDKKVNFVRTTQPFIEQFNITQAKIKHHLKSLDGLFQASTDVTRNDFYKFTNIISNTDTKIRGLAWLPYIHGDDRAKFESLLQKEMLTDIHIKKLTDKGLVTAPEQSLYIPIYFVEPLDINRAAIGLDISTHPIVSETVIKAINTKNYALSPLTSLAQQPNKRTSMIVYYPIYTTELQAAEDFMGLVEVVFEINVLLSDIYNQYGVDEFTYKFNYEKDSIYSQNSQNDQNRHSLFTHSVDIDMFDKKAQLSFSSTPDFERSLINWGYLSIMVAGCIIGVICVMFVFFIVTFKSSLTRKVNEGTAELLNKNNELQAANEAKNLFLANISHEYRTPLNAIMGFTEIAKRETSDNVAKDYLSKIDNASNILLNIVNDVLDLSKMQAGEFTLESIAFKPSEVTKSVIEMLNKNANEKSITLTCEFCSSFDLWVNGDELRFKQIIINLINNAIKFTSSGGVKVWGECIDDTDDTRCLIVKVIDTGIGIKLEDQERLFTSFAQAESSTTRKYGGTGLGLSIVKQLCALMDGDIQLISEVGQGSEFIIRLKLGKSTPVDKQSVPAKNELDNQKIDFSNMNVLVVEDNKVNQMIVQKQLSSLGAKSDLAGDGQEALDYLADNMPDIILMDIQMPNMDGFTASHKIKHDARLEHIPIVILSASVGKEDRDKASALGIFDFINKPFKQADLLRVLIKHAL
jgi:signal transduction histidine kinase